MIKPKIAPFFIGFLVLFLSSLSIRFLSSFSLQGQEGAAQIWIWVSLGGAALLLSQVFCLVGIRNRSIAVLGAILFTTLSFFSVTSLEANLSENRLKTGSSIGGFTVLQDHCGVYAGRAVIRIFDGLFMSPEYAALREYRIGCSCRLRHYLYLEKADALGCKTDETQIQCRIRWMGAFSENGFWNYEARHAFFQSIMKIWNETHQDESLVNYVLKDQELQISALNEFQQAGLSEASLFSRVKETKEIEENQRRLSKEIFETVAEAIQDGIPHEHPEPFRFKFHDAYVDFRAKNKN
jgi:hypothetical protein